jgi:hypothetical protein
MKVYSKRYSYRSSSHRISTEDRQTASLKAAYGQRKPGAGPGFKRWFLSSSPLPPVMHPLCHLALSCPTPLIPNSCEMPSAYEQAVRGTNGHIHDKEQSEKSTSMTPVTMQ